jgi:glucose-6-phosphate 1-dehydrogenase
MFLSSETYKKPVLFEDGMESTQFVIFGATGDLTHRKLIPALYRLYAKGKLPKDFAIVAVARKEKTHEHYREESLKSLMTHAKNVDETKANDLFSRLYYFKNNFDTDNYQGLKDYLDELDIKHGTKGNRIFYLATLPDHFEVIANNIQQHNFLNRKDNKKYRLIIEKPFGNDLDSATKLNKIISKVFQEEEIFRIDHYLGKETVQNLFALRFANQIFMPIWNSESIDNIQITVAETIGVGTRAGFYDKYGAVKDVLQNHILQILALVAMEQPKSFTTDEIKDKKVQAMKAMTAKEIVFAQYIHGTGKPYVEEEGINDGSKTETYAALKILINNWRWRGTPIYLRTGKCLKEKVSEVVIYFRPTMANIFNQDVKPNVLVIRLQPDESINLRFNAKMPGNEFKIDRVSMDFLYGGLFDTNTPEAYEKLLYDAFLGDSSLFTRWDEVQALWKVIDPITSYMKKNPDKLLYYPSGTWGPKQADDLLTSAGHHWRLRDGKP